MSISRTEFLGDVSFEMPARRARRVQSVFVLVGCADVVWATSITGNRLHALFLSLLIAANPYQLYLTATLKNHTNK